MIAASRTKTTPMLLMILTALPATAPGAWAQDSDGDGLSDADELLLAGGSGCPDPNDADSDDDGLNDGDEVNTYLTNPCFWDTDGDWLNDDWEVNGIPFGAGRRYVLASLGGARKKTLFVEADAMTLHNAGLNAAQLLAPIFANAPVSNPDGSSGIELVLVADDQSLPLANWTWAPPATPWPPEFAPFKMNYFGTAAERSDPDWYGPGMSSGPMREAKLKAYHYCVFANVLGNTAVSGIAEFQGNDMIVTLGGWGLSLTPVSWRTNAYLGTFAHEFGHNLGLGHGGPAGDIGMEVAPVNYKPNYHSVMNYSWQVPRLVGLQTVYTGTPTPSQVAYSNSWNGDYSGLANPALNEMAVDENFTSLCGGCVGPHAGHVTPVGPIGPWGYGYLEFESATGIDFNRNGTPGEAPVQVDLNNVIGGACNLDECTGMASATCTQVDLCPLPGADDWSNLEYLGGGANYASGVHGAALPPDGPELDFETVRMLSFLGGCAFTDPFDYHALGEALHGVSGWKGWDNNAAAGAATTNAQFHSEGQSLEISGSADLVHEFCAAGASGSGKWAFSVWQFIPAGFNSNAAGPLAGSAIVLMNTYADGELHENDHWSVQMIADSNVNAFKIWHGDGANSIQIPYVSNRWKKITSIIDLDDDWTRIYYDDALVSEYPWTGGILGGGAGASDIAAADLYAGGSSSVYYDDLKFIPINPDCGPADLLLDLDGDMIDTLGEAVQGTDPCNPDTDGDGALDGEDNCPLTENADQADTDMDGIGDACEVAIPCPADVNGDGNVSVTDLLGLLAAWGACP